MSDWYEKLALRQNLLILGVIALGALLGGLYYQFVFDTFRQPDAYDYAQIARQIAKGNGYTTYRISPLSWSKFPKIWSHPDFLRPPLYPIFVATGFTVFGISKSVPLVVSFLAYLISGILIFLIIKMIQDSNRAAFFGSILMITHLNIFRNGIRGMTESTYIFFVLATILVVLREKDHPYLVGVLSGLSYLTRFNHWFFFGGVLLAATLRCNQNKKNFLTKVFASMVIVLSPLMIRNWSLGVSLLYNHHIYEVLSFTPQYPGYRFYSLFNPPGSLEFVLNHPGLILQKWTSNLVKLYMQIPGLLVSGWPLLLLAVYYLSVTGFKSMNKCSRGVLIIFGTGFFLQGFLLSVVNINMRFFYPYLPVIFIFAGMGLDRLVETRGKVIGYGLFVVLYFINLASLIPLTNTTSINEADLNKIRAKIPADQPLVTNIPQFTAWYTDRPSLMITKYKQMKLNYPKFNYLLLETTSKSFFTREEFRQLMEDSEFQREFDVVNRFKGFKGNRLILFARSSG